MCWLGGDVSGSYFFNAYLFQEFYNILNLKSSKNEWQEVVWAGQKWTSTDEGYVLPAENYLT